MKANDLLNVLHHIPGETEIADFVLKLENGVISAAKALENIVAGKSVSHGAAPEKETNTGVKK